MRHLHPVLALFLAATLAACGGGGSGDQTPKQHFSAQAELPAE